MSFRKRLTAMTRTDRGARRWIYLPYAIVLTAELILSVGEAPLAMVWYCWVPIPFFVIQFAWPTVIGWAAATAAWFLCSFVSFLYARVCLGSEEFTNWFLVLYGLAPLVPLFVFRPRIRDAGSGGAKPPAEKQKEAG